MHLPYKDTSPIYRPIPKVKGHIPSMEQSSVFGKVKGHPYLERSKVKGQRSSSIYGLFILIWKGQRSTPKVKGQMTSSIYGLFCLIWYLKGQMSTQRSKVICHIWTILPYLAARGQRSLLDQNPYGTILLSFGFWIDY